MFHFNHKFLLRYNTPKQLSLKHGSFVSSDDQFKDKVVIVTGASSGIGKSCALEFARHGAKVAISSRRNSVLREVASEIEALGGKALCVKTDIRDIDHCEHLINKTVETFGGIDILINNAGISMRASFEDLDLKVIKNLMDTNFYGTVFCSKFALPHLLKSKVTIIGISSISGLAPLPGRTGYAASKRERDLILTRQGKSVVWLHKNLPVIADRLLLHEMAKEPHSPIVE